MPVSSTCSARCWATRSGVGSAWGRAAPSGQRIGNWQANISRPPLCRLRQASPLRQSARRHAATAAASAAHGGTADWRRNPRPENVAGDFYVDHTCIDCDTCRWMAPASFSRAGDMSAVTAQPQTAEQRMQAMQALLSCPTFSIHCRQRQPGELRAAQESFPLRVPGCSSVFWTGFAAEASFGATSYFIRRPQGNILVDVPRWTPILAQRLAQLGGVRWILLTHRDDVADHAAWAAHTGAQRIIHRLEASARQGTDKCEVQLEGQGPWRLPSGSSGGGGLSSSSSSSSSSATVRAGNGSSQGAEATAAAGDLQEEGCGHDDVELVFTPGHTAGCVSLLYRPDRALFSGDHLAWSARLGRLTIFRAYNWHSVAQQVDSVAALRPLDFLRVLPGHGRRAEFADAADRERQLQALLAAEGYTGA